MHTAALDPAVQEFLEEQGVILTNWIEIMDRFERGSATYADLE